MLGTYWAQIVVPSSAMLGCLQQQICFDHVYFGTTSNYVVASNSLYSQKIAMVSIDLFKHYEVYRIGIQFY